MPIKNSASMQYVPTPSAGRDVMAKKNRSLIDRVAANWQNQGGIDGLLNALSKDATRIGGKIEKGVSDVGATMRLPHGTKPEAYDAVTGAAINTMGLGYGPAVGRMAMGAKYDPAQMNMGFNRNKELPKEAAPLLKGRTDEEVSRMIELAKVQDILAGLEPRMSGPRSGEHWFPGANKKLSQPMSELEAGLTVIPRHNYDAPVTNMDWADMQGGTIFPLIGDRTGTGTVTRVAGKDLANPVELQGGKNYMRGADEGAWASERKALSGLANRLADFDTPFGVNMPMAGTGSDFAHMTTDVLHQLWSPKNMDKKGIDAVNKKIKTGVGVNGKFPDAPSIDSPEFKKMIETNSPLRKAYVQALDDAKLREMGGPDMGVIRHAITDEDFVNVSSPTSDVLNDQLMGWGVTDLHPEGKMRPSTHKTYDTDLLAGEKGYMGKAPLTPRSVVMRDWTRMRRGEAPSTYGDPRSIFTGPARMPQVVDQEVVDAINGYQAILKQRQ